MHSTTVEGAGKENKILIKKYKAGAGSEEEKKLSSYFLQNTNSRFRFQYYIK